MRFPLNPGSYSIGVSFQGHINSGGLPAIYPGQDYPSAEGTPIYAIEDGYCYFRVDGNGANYVMLQGATGLWFFVHLRNFEGSDRYVHEGDVIGYVGHTGYASGNHLHLGLKINNTYVDPVPYLTRANTTSNNSYIPPMNGYDSLIFGNSKYIVQPEDSCSRIVQNLGLPDTEHNWAHLAEVNGYSANDYLTFNTNLKAGEEINTGLNLAPVAVVNNDNDIRMLKDQLAKEQKDNTDKIDLINKADAESKAQLVTMYEKKIEDAQAERDQASNDKKEAMQRESIAEAKITQYQNAMHVDTGIITAVATGIINETVTGTGILTKWNSLVEKYIKSNTLKSILKYDIFVIIGWALSLPTLGVALVNSPIPARISGILNPFAQSFGYSITTNSVVAGIVGVAGIVVKLLLTRYDTTGDGKFSKLDLKSLNEILKSA